MAPITKGSLIRILISDARIGKTPAGVAEEVIVEPFAVVPVCADEDAKGTVHYECVAEDGTVVAVPLHKGEWEPSEGE